MKKITFTKTLTAKAALRYRVHSRPDFPGYEYVHVDHPGVRLVVCRNSKGNPVVFMDNWMVHDVESGLWVFKSIKATTRTAVVAELVSTMYRLTPDEVQAELSRAKVNYATDMLAM